MEIGDAPPPPTCPHCGSRDNKPKYNNNKKPEQLRVECHNCHKLFQRSPIRKVHPEGYKKGKVEEPMQYKVLIKQCDACNGTDAKFYSLNNNDSLQPRYKCKNPNCKKVFTPFKKSQLLNQKHADVKSVKQATTTGDTTTKINSTCTRAVDGNGPNTSYSSASKIAKYYEQLVITCVHNGPNDWAYNSIAIHDNTSGEACGLAQNAQNIYEDPKTYNIGITAHDHYGEGGGSTIYQHDIPNLPPTVPPYPAFNTLLDSTNIHDIASTSSSSASYHASSSTNVLHILHDHEYNMQLYSGGTYNGRFDALGQPPKSMFSGSIYQAPQVGTREGYTYNPQQLRNGGPIRRNCQDTPTFNRPPY